jgi:hypothetical protein
MAGQRLTNSPIFSTSGTARPHRCRVQHRTARPFCPPLADCTPTSLPRSAPNGTTFFSAYMLMQRAAKYLFSTERHDLFLRLHAHATRCEVPVQHRAAQPFCSPLADRTLTSAQCSAKKIAAHCVPGGRLAFLQNPKSHRQLTRPQFGCGKAISQRTPRQELTKTPIFQASHTRR